MKRYFRGPLLWILGFVLLVVLVMQVFGRGGITRRPTPSRSSRQIQRRKGQQSAKIVDKDQRIEVTLKPATQAR